MENTELKVTLREKLELEMVVYSVADNFWTGYQGGVWSFSREGKFWYPHNNSIEICNPKNYFDGVLSSKAAGIALSMFAANQLCWKYHERNSFQASEHWGEYYYFLNDYLLDNFSDEDIGKVRSFLD